MNQDSAKIEQSESTNQPFNLNGLFNCQNGFLVCRGISNKEQ
ncbi:MAG: hypothetical protein ABI543_12900 [Ignavibacteria bacterium]